jgi:hypothetical protein
VCRGIGDGRRGARLRERDDDAVPLLARGGVAMSSSGEYARLGHPTHPKMARVEAPEDDPREAITKVPCPVCRQGLVPPEVAVSVDLALAFRKDES